MNTKLNWTAALLFMALLAFSFATMRKYNPEAHTLEIRSYNVPTTRLEEIRNVLNRMFAEDKADGNAQSLGNNTLVVKASGPYQAGIAKLVNDVSEKKTPARTIHFDYWLVAGQASKDSNAEAIAPLSKVLGTINESQGSQRYTVLEHIGFNSLDRREVTVKSSWAQVKNYGREVEGGAIELLTHIEAHALGELNVNTQVKPGEFVVLGENGMQPNAKEIIDKGIPEEQPAAKEVYHIIRAEFVQ